MMSDPPMIEYRKVLEAGVGFGSGRFVRQRCDNKGGILKVYVCAAVHPKEASKRRGS